MQYSQIRAFHAVATYGGYQAAAQAIPIQQPTLSGHVKALERAHGVKLFRRDGRHVVLTETGQGLKRLADELFDVADRVDAHLGELEELSRGSLRLAVDTSSLAGELIALFKTEYPGLQMEVSIGNSEFVSRAVRTSSADLGILAGKSEGANFNTLFLTSVPIVAVAPEGHPLASKRRVKLSDLRNEQVLLRERGSNTRKIFDEACQARQVELASFMEMGRSEMIMAGVSHGLGIGILEEGEAMPLDRVEILELSDIDFQAEEYLMWSTAQEEVNVVKAFIEMARRWAGQ